MILNEDGKELSNFFSDLFRKYGAPRDSEDKQWYMKYGGIEEKKFLDRNGKNGTERNLPVILNPEKVNIPWALDLVHTEKERFFIDLKTQTTPYYTSGCKRREPCSSRKNDMGIDPQYEHTINEVDIVEYMKKEKKEGIKIGILLWNIIWDEKGTAENNAKYGTNLFLREGLWFTTPSEIFALYEAGKSRKDIPKGRQNMDKQKDFAKNGSHNKEWNYNFDLRDIKKRIFYNVWKVE